MPLPSESNTKATFGTPKVALHTPTDELRSLGATIGGKEHRRKPFKARLRATQAMRHKLATINHPAVELKLAKHCLGESDMQHFLRMCGADLIDA